MKLCINPNACRKIMQQSPWPTTTCWSHCYPQWDQMQQCPLGLSLFCPCPCIVPPTLVEWCWGAPQFQSNNDRHTTINNQNDDDDDDNYEPIATTTIPLWATLAWMNNSSTTNIQHHTAPPIMITTTMASTQPVPWHLQILDQFQNHL